MPRCHIILANLRAPGDKGYKIPRGFLFNYITCANYTAEIWGWLLFAAGVQALPAALFALLGGGQMAIWAMQKHARLRKVGRPTVFRSAGLSFPRALLP
jgi:very-long-chain enoyl-CoA reductase